MRRFFNLILASALMMPPLALAKTLSLMQDEYGISCEAMVKGSPLQSLSITPRDDVVTVVWAKNKSEVFKTTHFLGTALLAKGTSDKNYLLFQIDPNGKFRVFVGPQYSFLEKSCEDTGASKRCKVDGLGHLFWSAEQLGLDLDNKSKFRNDVRHYGVYPKTGTYFQAIGKGAKSIALVDFGAPLEMIVGEEHHLKCLYK